MAVNRFITRAYPLKFSPEKAPDDASLQTVSREEVSGLETRIFDWTEQLQAGPAGGKLYPNIRLSPIGSTPIIAVPYFLGAATWEVVDNSTISGTKIVVTQTGNVQSGVVGTDISLGTDAADTANNIFLYFVSKGVWLLANGNELSFRTYLEVAAVGVLVSTDKPTAFKPANGVAVADSLLPVLLTETENADKMRLGDFLRFSYDEIGENLLPDRVKVISMIESPDYAGLSEVTFDQIPPGLRGGETIWAEHDNAVPTERTSSSGPSWNICSSTSNASIWTSPLGPSAGVINLSSLYLRTDRATTVSLWVW